MTTVGAQINTSMGVQGTFSVLLRSQVYNLLGHLALDRARETHALGQRLALHYDLPATLPEGDPELEAFIQADFDKVRRDLPGLEPTFAWHNTTPDLVSRGLTFEVPSLVNIYSASFIKEIPCYSDSNTRYSVEEFKRIIDAQERSVMHMLFHPLNWIAGSENMIEIRSAIWKYI